jgi:hypothetical protein
LFSYAGLIVTSTLLVSVPVECRFHKQLIENADIATINERILRIIDADSDKFNGSEAELLSESISRSRIVEHMAAAIAQF